MVAGPRYVTQGQLAQRCQRSRLAGPAPRRDRPSRDARPVQAALATDRPLGTRSRPASRAAGVRRIEAAAGGVRIV